MASVWMPCRALAIDPKAKTKASELAYQVAYPKEKKLQYADLMGETYVSRFGDTIEESLQLIAARVF